MQFRLNLDENFVQILLAMSVQKTINMWIGFHLIRSTYVVIINLLVYRARA